MAKMFEPWQSRPDSENTTFNATTFAKWYNGLDRCNTEVVHPTGAPQLQYEKYHLQHEPTPYICLAETCQQGTFPHKDATILSRRGGL
jgi:hypothetical protein